MRIEHIALYVKDLEGARDFFCTFFDAVSNEGYHNTATGFRSYFLTFENDARLEIMTRPQMDDLAKSPSRTGYVHLAFSVGSRERVDSLTAKLSAQGFTVLSGPRITGDGYYESCIEGFEGNILEITV